MWITFILVSFFASITGCICGIGGGVIIKPVLDAFHVYSVSTISFLSGSMVLAMTAYSVAGAWAAHEPTIQKGVSRNLGIGAALGGIAGKQLFDMVKSLFADPNLVGAVQAAALFAVTFGTLLYTIRRDTIHTHRLSHPAGCVLIGLALGLLAAFLGIGGGPINLVVLYFFFSMETKTASQNSLYIILISQLGNLIFTVVCGNVPDFPAVLLVCMVMCGILGGAIGRRINRRIDGKTVNRLFRGLLVVIMLICCYNFYSFLN